MGEEPTTAAVGLLPPPRDGEPDALTRARHLTDEGRTLEAVDLLTQANGKRRNGRIERVLPRLRRAAFDELDRTGGLPQWPAPATRAAPPVGPRGLPEVDVAELDAELLRASINEHGSLLVRGLADAAEAEHFVEGIDQAFTESEGRRQRAKEGQRPGPGSPWFSPLSVPGNKEWSAGQAWVRLGGGVLAADSPRLLFDLLDLYDRRGLRRVVGDYLGERPVLSATKCTLRCVRPDSDSHWHQDGSFLGDGLRVLNVWLTLTQCGTEAPGLDLIPRRLDGVVETGTGSARFENMVGEDVLGRLSSDTPVIRPQFQVGEALLFDELFLHSTAAHPSMPRPRYAVESWFFAPSAYPDPNAQVPLVW